jgi:hypothetical protein
MSCWEKAHDFYIRKRLFKDDTEPMNASDVTSDKLNDLQFQRIRMASDLNKRKKEALGIAWKKRAGKKRNETTMT